MDEKLLSEIYNCLIKLGFAPRQGFGEFKITVTRHRITDIDFTDRVKYIDRSGKKFTSEKVVLNIDN